MGTLNMRTHNAKLEGTPSDVEISISGNSGAKVAIQTTQPRVLIDQSDSFDAVGVGGILRNMDKFAARSNQKGINQIGRIAREGLQCLRIERGGSGEGPIIAQIARNKGFKQPIHLEVRDIPKPKTHAIMGTVDIQDASEPIRSDTVKTRDTQRYTPGTVDITAWKDKPFVDIFLIPGDVRGTIVDCIV
jgi:hypothetical protein